MGVSHRRSLLAGMPFEGAGYVLMEGKRLALLEARKDGTTGREIWDVWCEVLPAEEDVLDEDPQARSAACFGTRELFTAALLLPWSAYLHRVAGGLDAGQKLRDDQEGDSVDWPVWCWMPLLLGLRYPAWCQSASTA